MNINLTTRIIPEFHAEGSDVTVSPADNFLLSNTLNTSMMLQECASFRFKQLGENYRGVKLFQRIAWGL